MPEERSDPSTDSNWVSSLLANSVPGQSSLGLPPVSSLGSVSSLAAAQNGWQSPLDQASDEARAAAEAAAGDAFSRRLEYAKAWERYRQAVELDPSKADYHFRLGVAAVRAGRPELVEHNLLEALRLSPNFADAHDALGWWCMESRQLDRALKHSEVAHALDPKNINYVTTRAAVLGADGQTAAAWGLVKPLLDAGARHPRLAILYARLAPRLGHERQALVEVEWALQIDVARRMESCLRFEAASLLDRMGRYDEAFEHARRANELVRRDVDLADFAGGTDRKIAYFTRQRLLSLPKSMLDSRRIVFIVGMPRSGTTLVEQVLASHPQVFGGGESPTLQHIYEELGNPSWAQGTGYPDCLDFLSPLEADRLAKRYLSAVESAGACPEPACGAGSAVYITDKTPWNGMHLGLIQLLMPNCHVIHCTRSPLDTCLSCYFTEFARGNEFAYDLEHLGAVFGHYQRLMAHWKQVLTIPIHEVRYEDLVLDLEGQSRRIADFLHLPWDERCLKFYENPRRVFTASREQVRQPVYLSSIGRWKNYQKHLGKLIDALGPRA